MAKSAFKTAHASLNSSSITGPFAWMAVVEWTLTLPRATPAASMANAVACTAGVVALTTIVSSAAAVRVDVMAPRARHRPLVRAQAPELEQPIASPSWALLRQAQAVPQPLVQRPSMALAVLAMMGRCAATGQEEVVAPRRSSPPLL